MTLRCDVCIVGSGVAGAIVARELAGRDVILVEAGGRPVMRDPRVWYDAWMDDAPDPFAAFTYAPEEYVASGDTRLELRGGLLRARGGTTLHWEGLAFRLQPEDFRLHSRAGVGADWPLSYEELEPYYSIAERTLQVAGDASNPGHPPRSAPFPLPPFDAQAADEAFLRAMSALGFSTQYCCIARNSRSINGMAACQQTGTCYYCPIGGRFTGDQLVDSIESRANVRVLTSTSALRLEFASKRRAVALDVLRRESGARDRIEAETFVLCAGAVETPKLLLASASPFWPRGAGNDRGHVGRFLASHAVQSGFAEERAPNRERVVSELAFITSVSRHFDDARAQPRGKFLLWPMAARVPLDQLLLDGRSPAEIERELEAPRLQGLTFQLEQVSSRDNFIAIEPGTDSLGLPRTRVSYSHDDRVRQSAAAARAVCERIFERMNCGAPTFDALDASSHFLGTCRMSEDASGGVVSRELRLHDADNVHVCGGSVFPSTGAANPTLTIAALAHRLGRALGERP